MSKVATSWAQVQTGDIISFRYQPVDPNKKPRMQTVLILNPKFPRKLKDGTKKFYINGIKLEESNIRVLTSYGQTWRLLESIGEVEIVDLLNKYRNKKKLTAQFLGRGGAWLDTGSIEDFYNTSAFVSNLENRQGLKIAAIEEIAFNNKWIGKKEIVRANKFYGKCNYSQYLTTLIKK